MKIRKLNEDAFQEIIPPVEAEIVVDSEVEPNGPELGEDTGIANVIHSLIIDENEAIQGYNNAAAGMEKYPELVKLMHDIASEEFAHVGELQKALELLSPNVANIMNGEVEAEEKLNEAWYDPSDYAHYFKQHPEYDIESVLKKHGKDQKFTNQVLKLMDTIVDESINEDTKKKPNGKWVNKGKDGEHGEFKTKKAADAQRKAMYANGYHESLENDDKLSIGEYVAKYSK